MTDLVHVCKIWGSPAAVVTSQDTRPWGVFSPRAGGEYQLFVDVELALESVAPQVKARLTTWLIDERRLGNKRPLITIECVEQAKLRARSSVPSRAIRLLAFLAEQTEHVGANALPNIAFRPDNRYDKSPPSELDLGARRDLYLAVTELMASDELIYLRSYLLGKKWIDVNQTRTGFFVTVEGFAKLDELASTQVSSDQAFVAMWFDPGMDHVWSEGIQPACQDAGYRALRVDKKDHNNKIDDEIVAEIRRSRFVVADFTHGAPGQRGGVYYEAGLAHGLGLPVIFTCKNECLKDVHFDTRQYNHIPWNTPEELKLLLAQRISATLGDGPHRIYNLRRYR